MTRAGEGYADGPEPELTERDDLRDGRTGWQGATQGTKSRVAQKHGFKLNPKDYEVDCASWGRLVKK